MGANTLKIRFSKYRTEAVISVSLNQAISFIHKYIEHETKYGMYSTIIKKSADMDILSQQLWPTHPSLGKNISAYGTNGIKTEIITNNIFIDNMICFLFIWFVLYLKKQLFSYS